MTTVRRIVATIALAFMPYIALAESVVLTFTHGDQSIDFDINALTKMGETQFTTTTSWTEGEQTFVGVSLHSFLDQMGVDSGVLKATAINDYAVEIPVSDAVEGGPIIAYHRNGQEMSVRDKGPLWIVYPFDTNPKYQTEVIYSRSIWQLDRINVIE